MAKKQITKPSPTTTAKETPQKPVAPTQHGVWIGACLLLALVAYFPAFKAEFVNWDDDLFSTKSELIRSFSHFGAFFTTPVAGNYHPLTMLSLAVNYAISGDEPWSYHALNILLHLANTALAYWLALRLSGGKFWVALTTGLLFAVHPMHVESVAWVSERKDVLYGFFFLLGLLYYVRYTERPSAGLYATVIGCFLLSLLSKPAAVVFPVVLLLLDYWLDKPLNWKTLAAKAPYFAISLAWGLLTTNAQKSIGATQSADVFPFSSTFFFGFYGFMVYWLKLVLPTGLCTFYPFPPVNKPLPAAYYLAPLFFAAMAATAWWARARTKVPLFSLGFFLATIVLVLQFFTVGSAIYADRYAYLPYWGAFFMVGYGLHYLVEDRKTLAHGAAWGLVAAVGLLLTFLSNKQTLTWRNSQALWEQAVKIRPSNRAYAKLAEVHRQKKNNDLALQYYNQAISFNALDEGSIATRGNIYYERKDFKKALEDYNRSIAIKPTVPTLSSRGWCYAEQGEYDKGLADLNQALAMDSTFLDGYRNRGFLYQRMKRPQEAKKDFLTCLRMEPNNADIACQVGVVCYEMQDWAGAYRYFDQAAKLSPKVALFYFNRSKSSQHLGNKAAALQDALQAQTLGMKIPEDYWGLVR